MVLKKVNKLLILFTIGLLLFGCQSAVRFSSNSTQKEKSEVDRFPFYSLNETKKALLNECYNWIGVPYCYGGATDNCVDCSGFVQKVYQKVGISLPRTSKEQALVGKKVNLGNICPTDLIFFGKYGKINHVAIYVGKGQIIHSSTSRGVTTEKLNDSLINQIVEIRRILD